MGTLIATWAPSAPEAQSGVVTIVSSGVVCNEPKGGVWPSDHFGVYAELRAVPLTEPPPFDDAA